MDESDKDWRKDWRSFRGVIKGDDACIIEDLHHRGLDGDNADIILLFADLDLQHMRPQEVETMIVHRCQERAIKAEPGETEMILKDGWQKWTFRGWRLSK